MKKWQLFKSFHLALACAIGDFAISYYGFKGVLNLLGMLDFFPIIIGINLTFSFLIFLVVLLEGVEHAKTESEH